MNAVITPTMKTPTMKIIIDQCEIVYADVCGRGVFVVYSWCMGLMHEQVAGNRDNKDNDNNKLFCANHCPRS